MDQGIGVIKKEKNSSILEINEPAINLKFKDYYNNYKKYLRVISVDELKKKKKIPQSWKLKNLQEI